LPAWRSTSDTAGRRASRSFWAGSRTSFEAAAATQTPARGFDVGYVSRVQKPSLFGRGFALWWTPSGVLVAVVARR
jgi:hypothetical protein